MNSYAISHELSKWHFPRRQVAENYLKTLSSGVVLSTTIFSPSQTGLSNFLINDICPCAHEQKYLTVYIDLSDSEIAVTAAVLMGLEKTLVESSFLRHGFNILKGILQSSNAEGVEVKTWASKEDMRNPRFFMENKEQHLVLIDNYFKKLSSYRSVLVLIDHAHQLNQLDLGRDFSVYFRNLIIKNSNNIKPLYATNDMDKWGLVFKNRNFPLNSEGAFLHKLPSLGKVFVREVLLRMRLDISMEEATQCFAMTGNKPGFFIFILMGWSKTSGKAACDYFSERLGKGAFFE